MNPPRVVSIQGQQVPIRDDLKQFEWADCDSCGKETTQVLHSLNDRRRFTATCQECGRVTVHGGNDHE